MIDIENYGRAIAWLRRSLIELRQEPESDIIRLGILHRFEVTHNISEALLREAYVSLDVDEQAPILSLRELLRRASEEGIHLPAPARWLRYGLILESTKQGWIETATFDLEAILPILPRYADELDAFAKSLKQRMAPLA